MMKNDTLFKYLLIVILTGFLFAYYQKSQVGRYQMGDGFGEVIDTKTGNVYFQGKLRFELNE